METHTEKRMQVKELWKNNEIKVVDVIRRKWGMQQFAEDDIHKVCGVLEVRLILLSPAECLPII